MVESFRIVFENSIHAPEVSYFLCVSSRQTDTAITVRLDAGLKSAEADGRADDGVDDGVDYNKDDTRCTGDEKNCRAPLFHPASTKI